MAIYEVAFFLGKTVTELREDIPLTELQGWFNYFERRPFEWRADQRAAMLLNAQGVKEKPQAMFSSLAAVKRGDPSGFKGSSMQHFIAKATGGDQLPFLMQ